MATYKQLQSSFPSSKEMEDFRDQCTVGNEFDVEAYEKLLDDYTGLLQRIPWYRVIFDEVHQLKNIKSRSRYFRSEKRKESSELISTSNNCCSALDVQDFLGSQRHTPHQQGEQRWGNSNTQQIGRQADFFTELISYLFLVRFIDVNDVADFEEKYLNSVRFQYRIVRLWSTILI